MKTKTNPKNTLTEHTNANAFGIDYRDSATETKKPKKKKNTSRDTIEIAFVSCRMIAIKSFHSK